jgi:hypothetical protein
MKHLRLVGLVRLAAGISVRFLGLGKFRLGGGERLPFGEKASIAWIQQAIAWDRKGIQVSSTQTWKTNEPVPCLKKKPAWRERLATAFIDVLRAEHDEAIAGIEWRKKVRN